jgi:hypothetical protein
MYVDFLKSLNPEILSFIEEGPLAGVENLRRGLQVMIGQVDLKLVQVCASRQDIAKELQHRASFSAPADTFVHYLYLQRSNQDPNQYLTRVLASVRTIGVLAAIMNIAVDLCQRGPDFTLMEAVVVSCISGLSVVKLGASSFSCEIQNVYRADLDGLRAAFLVKCVRISKTTRSFEILLFEASALAETASRGHLYVRLPDPGTRSKSIVMNEKQLDAAASESCRKFMKHLFDSPDVADTLPVAIKGEAMSRFG